jgi:hypothetical protein
MTLTTQAEFALSLLTAEAEGGMVCLDDVSLSTEELTELTAAGLIEVIPADDTCGGEAWVVLN